VVKVEEKEEEMDLEDLMVVEAENTVDYSEEVIMEVEMVEEVMEVVMVVEMEEVAQEVEMVVEMEEEGKGVEGVVVGVKVEVMEVVEMEVGVQEVVVKEVVKKVALSRKNCLLFHFQQYLLCYQLLLVHLQQSNT